MIELSLKYWNISPMILALLPTVAVVYFLFVTNVSFLKRAAFLAGWVLTFIAICSPLHWLARNNLMSAHMVSHVLLLMVAAPLLLMGFPNRFFRHRLPQRLSRFFRHRLWVPWLIGVGCMWFWHFPPVHDALLHSGGAAACVPGSASTGSPLLNAISGFYYPSLLLAGLLMSWPLISPVKRLKGPPGVLYLFTACIGCSLLGIILTFAPHLIYEHHITRPAIGALRGQFNISPADDQQLAGLIMWIPGCLLYATAAIVVMLRWFAEEEKYQQPVNSYRHERT